MILQAPQDQFTEAADTVASLVNRMLTSVTGAGMDAVILRNLVLTVVVVLGVVVFRRLLLRVTDRRLEDVHARYRWAKGSAYGAFVLSVVLLLAIWFQWFGSLGTFLGLLTAGLAIALRDPVVDLAGWIFILWRRPFDLGDRIQIDDRAGDVVDIRLFQFTILEIGNWVGADQSTGRIIHIPNAKIFTDSVANYTSQFEYLWNEIPVLVTFESDWRKAKEILEEVVREQSGDVSDEAERAMRKASRKFLIFYQKLTPVVYTSVQDSGVALTLRYLCKPRQRRGTAQGIWETILDRFAEHDDIDFAYPTYRTYLNALEGKEGAREELRMPGPPPA